ncbi:MAG TPA: hypothetical protein DGT21_15700 [Armatimonadetes bacterium]|jgi:putative hydrolase of the HAD superfamily|nr:hypothetical protein [Armatimonadota bacterium]
MLKALLIDLDETLYRPQTGMLSAGDRAITAFIATHLGIAAQQADSIRVDLWLRYGTTAAGFEREYGVAQADFYAATIETVDPTEYISPEPELAAMLAQLPLRLCLFTNATEAYAEGVLHALRVREQFSTIYDIASRDWCPKPEPRAYDTVMSALELPPAEVGFVEDHVANIPPARELGWTVFLMRQEHPAAHYVLDDILDLEALLRRERLCESGPAR